MHLFKILGLPRLCDRSKVTLGPGMGCVARRVANLRPRHFACGGRRLVSDLSRAVSGSPVRSHIAISQLWCDAWCGLTTLGSTRPACACSARRARRAWCMSSPLDSPRTRSPASHMARISATAPAPRAQARPGHSSVSYLLAYRYRPQPHLTP